MSFEKPTIVLSACLDLQPVRYNGEVVRDEFVIRLRNYCNVVPVCPEVSIGLGVPRDKIIVYVKDGQFRVCQPSTGRDLTQDLYNFSKNFLKNLKEVDGFLLKSKSPSCGVSNTTVYKDFEGKEFHGKGKGIFALEVLNAFNDLPVEDEGRLKNPAIRDQFLTHIFALSHWRSYKKGVKSIKDLMEFHRRYKYMLLAKSPLLLKSMGRLLASYNGKQDIHSIITSYEEMFKKALKKKASAGGIVNSFMHILGHLSDFLKPSEKRHFLHILEQFRKGKVSVKVPRELLRSWAYRFEDQYILSQTFLNPYPEELET